MSRRKTDLEIKILNYILKVPVRISFGTPPIMTDGRGFLAGKNPANKIYFVSFPINYSLSSIYSTLRGPSY